MSLSKLIFLLLSAGVCQAQGLNSPDSFEGKSTNPPTTYNSYYTITEKQKSLLSEKSFERPFGPNQGPLALSELSEFAEYAKKFALNLLSWKLHSEQRPIPTDQYIRKSHFGRWINDPFDDTCMNTRGKVLVRDSESQVHFKQENHCVVEAGKWLDPYSNQEFTSSKEVQIDHMVPLKHAYLAGAFKWDYKARCLYANFMGYKDHLIPASVHENTSKGDRAPDKYLPPELSYRCQYVKNWLAIKLIWRLNMTEEEVQAIHEVITNYNCNPADFKMTVAELNEQRRFILKNIEYCTINKR